MLVSCTLPKSHASTLLTPGGRSCLVSLATAGVGPVWSLVLTKRLQWTEQKTVPIPHSIRRDFFPLLNFTLLSVCTNESGTHSGESITCMPEIRGNNCAGLLLEAQASAQFWEVESKKKSDNKSRLPWCESSKWHTANKQTAEAWETRSIILSALLQARKSQIFLLLASLWHKNCNFRPWRMNFP